MKIVLRVIGSFVLLCFLIIILGKPAVTLMDRVFLGKPVIIKLETGGMKVVDFNTLLIDMLPTLDSVKIYSDSSLVIDVSGIEFPLGTVRKDPDNEEVFHVLKDQGDKISIRYEHSYFSWLTPFDIHLMWTSPSNKRHSYYTMTWMKAGGQSLNVRWKFQEYKYDGNDWRDWRSPSIGDGETSLIEMVVSGKRSVM